MCVLVTTAGVLLTSAIWYFPGYLGCSLWTAQGCIDGRPHCDGMVL